MTVSARALLVAAASMNMRATAPDGGGVTVVTCRACGEIHGGVNAERYVEAPHPCVRCHGDDWRPISEIAKDIAARVRRAG